MKKFRVGRSRKQNPFRPIAVPDDLEPITRIDARREVQEAGKVPLDPFLKMPMCYSAGFKLGGKPAISNHIIPLFRLLFAISKQCPRSRDMSGDAARLLRA